MKKTCSNFFQMLKIIYKYRLRYIIFSIFKIVVEATYPFVPIISMKYIINALLVTNNFYEVIKIIGIMGILTFILTNSKIALQNLTKINAKYLMVPLSIEFCKNAIQMDLEDCENSKIQDEMYKASYILINSDNLEIYLNSINNMIINLIQLIMASVILVSLNIWIVGIVVICAIINVKLNIQTQNKNLRLYTYIMNIERKWKYIMDISTKYEYGKTIRLYHLKEWLISKGKSNRSEYLNKRNEQFYNTRNNNIVISIINSIEKLLIFIYLSFAVIKEYITLGDFSMYVESIFQLTNSFNKMIKSITDIYTNNNYINDYLRFIEHNSKLRSTGIRLVKQQSKHEIKFNHVSFKYPNSTEYTLRDISLTIQSGEKLSIVGENGSGKTTLVKLLMRLYDVTEGEILLDGINIKEYDYEAYMKIFSTVFQDYYIFATSIYENIVFSKIKDVNLDRVDEIIKINYLDEKISQLNQGANSIVSKLIDENGVEFSGGEKQILALCRAMYKNGSIMILDEPTASLSPLAEAKLYERFNEITQDKTAIFISHRLSSSRFCDKVCVLNNGRIIEYGTHSELITNNNEYAKMYYLQAHYYLEG